MLVSTVPTASLAAAYRPAAATAAPAANTHAEAPVVDLAAVKTAIASVKEAIKPLGNSLEFNVDESSGRTVVRVVDLETQQVIRQIPSEEMVELSRVLKRLEGLLLHKRA